jgi:hypothetical protein
LGIRELFSRHQRERERDRETERERERERDRERQRQRQRQRDRERETERDRETKRVREREEERWTFDTPLVDDHVPELRIGDRFRIALHGEVSWADPLLWSHGLRALLPKDQPI